MTEPAPVPADWYRDTPPRSTEWLFEELIEASPVGHAGHTAVRLINAAWDRIESDEYHGETYRDAWFAALRAEMPAYPPVRSERPHELGYCQRPNCVRKTPHAGPHKDAHGDSLCIAVSRAGTPPVRHICVRTDAHLINHEFVAWPEPPKVNF